MSAVGSPGPAGRHVTAAGPGRLHVVILGPNIPAHIEGPIEDKDLKLFEILG